MKNNEDEIIEIEKTVPEGAGTVVMDANGFTRTVALEIHTTKYKSGRRDVDCIVPVLKMYPDLKPTG